MTATAAEAQVVCARLSATARMRPGRPRRHRRHPRHPGRGVPGPETHTEPPRRGQPTQSHRRMNAIPMTLRRQHPLTLDKHHRDSRGDRTHSRLPPCRSGVLVPEKAATTTGFVPPPGQRRSLTCLVSSPTSSARSAAPTPRERHPAVGIRGPEDVIPGGEKPYLT